MLDKDEQIFKYGNHLLHLFQGTGFQKDALYIYMNDIVATFYLIMMIVLILNPRKNGGPDELALELNSTSNKIMKYVSERTLDVLC